MFISLALGSLQAQQNQYKFVHFEELFKEGIYVTFDDFKHQNPVSRHAIIALEDKNDPDFLLKVLSYDRFSYFDSTGQKHTLPSGEIWGMVRRNALYIFYGYALSKVHFNGRWGYFTSYKRTLQPGMNVMPGSYYAVQVPFTAGKRAQTMIVDLKNGKISPFKRKDLMEVLNSDSLLKNEYESLTRRKQKQLKYLYLRKLNDKIEFTFPK